MNKERTNIKREFALKEREHLLKEVENVEAVLRGELSPEDVAGLWIRLNTKLSFSESVSWLQPLIEDGLSDIQGRLEKIVDALEREFSTSYSVGNQSEEELEKFIRRSKAYSIVRLYIDSALILYVLGRNGAALIDLHAAVERQAIESLSKHILSPERAEIGLRLIERSTLPDISVMLRDCNLIDEKDVKFAQNLNKLRNGLAHRNTKVISNAVFSGRELLEVDIDSVMSDVDYIPFVIGAINFLIKIMDWDEELECGVCHVKS
ncbi:MAG: hypothetical protein WKF74_09925 [Pyrinomonadaceae bacterium]